MLTATYHNMLNIVNKLFGGLSSNNLKKYENVVKKINNFETEISRLSDNDLKNKTDYFKNKIQVEKVDIDEILPEAFSIVREVSKRTLNMRHFDVQLIGGMVLHEGRIAEMKTGEGKTLAATLPAYLNAISGKSVHIVTVNDYLAKRDSEWMGEIYKFLNLTVGCVNSNTNHEVRAKEWDDAAGHAIAGNAGAIVTTLDGKSFKYGKEDYKNPTILIKRNEILNA